MYQRIRDLREDRDLTQKNMGEILNCSQRIYSNYECGDVDIPTHILSDMLPPLKSLILKWGLLAQWLY